MIELTAIGVPSKVPPLIAHIFFENVQNSPSNDGIWNKYDWNWLEVAEKKHTNTHHTSIGRVLFADDNTESKKKGREKKKTIKNSICMMQCILLSAFFDSKNLISNKSDPNDILWTYSSYHFHSFNVFFSVPSVFSFSFFTFHIVCQRWWIKSCGKDWVLICSGLWHMRCEHPCENSSKWMKFGCFFFFPSNTHIYCQIYCTFSCW